MSIRSLTQLFTHEGLLRDGDGDGLPDGLGVRFSVGRTPGAIDVAARLGLESAAFTPGFTTVGALAAGVSGALGSTAAGASATVGLTAAGVSATVRSTAAGVSATVGSTAASVEGAGVPVWFGPDNPACPIPPYTVAPGCGLVALAADGVVVTGSTFEAGRDAARWLASTFPYAAPGGPLLSDMAGGRPIWWVTIRDGAVVDMKAPDEERVPSVDKPTVEGAPAAPPFAAEPVGDLPAEGAARLFTVAGLMGSSDGVRHDRGGWQVSTSPETSPVEIAALCELAARTGVEAVGLGFPFAVDAVEPGRLAVTLVGAGEGIGGSAGGDMVGAPWSLDAEGLAVVGTPEERAATLRELAAGAGLVDGLHAGLFTSRATLAPTELSRGEAIFDLALEQEWEVDRFRRVWRESVLPQLAPGEAVFVDLRLSEPLPVREALAREIAGDVLALGIPGVNVRVLSAYKQGFHWLEEEMLPRLQEAGALNRVTVTCAPFAAGDGALEMEIRWLQELYPADELLGAALGVPVAFELATESQPDIYALTAYRPDGTVALAEGFSPVCSARDYLPEFPVRGRVHPPTGLLRVEQGGRPILETAVDTDAEAFWTAYQEQVLPRLRAHVTEAYGPAPDPGAQPFFGTLVVEVAMSEDDRRLEIREEQISPLDALHEDLYFYTLDYLDELGKALTGKGYPAPGAVEPWVVQGEGGGPRARVRLYGRPQMAGVGLGEAPGTGAAPGAGAAPSHGGGASGGGLTPPPVEGVRGGIPATPPADSIPMDTVIGPDQLPPYLALLSGLDGVRVWRTGLSFGGRPTWALSVTAPTAGAIAPPHKLSAWRPTLLVNARRHANEVSSTNAILKLAETAAQQGLAAKVNLVISPMENVDGAAVHYEMQQVHPNWKLHAARFNAAGVDFGSDAFERAPRFGESRTLPTLWRAFQPDVVLDDHGYPSHEWVQPFSGYSSPPYFKTSWWMPNALIYSIHRWMDPSRFPANAAVQEGLRAALAARLTANAEVAEYTRTLLDRYVAYGRRYLPDRFPLETHEGFIALVRQTAAGPDARSFVGRFPHITAAEVITEVPDETAQGEYLALCARAHLEGDLAVLGYLAGRPQPVVRRRWTEGGVTYWMTGRERPLTV